MMHGWVTCLSDDAVGGAVLAGLVCDWDLGGLLSRSRGGGGGGGEAEAEEGVHGNQVQRLSWSRADLL